MHEATAAKITNLVEEEVSSISDARVLQNIRSLQWKTNGVAAI